MAEDWVCQSPNSDPCDASFDLGDVDSTCLFDGLPSPLGLSSVLGTNEGTDSKAVYDGGDDCPLSGTAEAHQQPQAPDQRQNTHISPVNRDRVHDACGDEQHSMSQSDVGNSPPVNGLRDHVQTNSDGDTENVHDFLNSLDSTLCLHGLPGMSETPDTFPDASLNRQAPGINTTVAHQAVYPDIFGSMMPLDQGTAPVQEMPASFQKAMNVLSTTPVCVNSPTSIPCTLPQSVLDIIASMKCTDPETTDRGSTAVLSSRSRKLDMQSNELLSDFSGHSCDHGAHSNSAVTSTILGSPEMSGSTADKHQPFSEPDGIGATLSPSVVGMNEVCTEPGPSDVSGSLQCHSATPGSANTNTGVKLPISKKGSAKNSRSQKRPVPERRSETRLIKSLYKGATTSLAKQIAYCQPNKGTAKKKRFDCPECECGKSFSAKANLAAHMVVHTGENPFPCPVESCGKIFAWRSSLKYHCDEHEKRKELVFIPKEGLVDPRSLPEGSPDGSPSDVPSDLPPGAPSGAPATSSAAL